MFSVRGQKGKYLIKTYPEKEYTVLEARNLRNIAPASLHIPASFGSGHGYLIQSFIQGELFEDTLVRLSPAARRRRYRTAIEELVRIHTSIHRLKNKRWLHNRRFGVPSFRKRLRAFQELVSGEGFTSYEKYAGPVPRRWRLAVARVPVERLVHSLGVCTQSFVMGHGDYKPNNIIFTDDGWFSWTVDWLGMSKAQPWYDLAYLLVHERAKDTFLSYYLRLMHERGFLRNVSERRARKLFLDGMIFQELQRAKSNATKIHSRRAAHHMGEFRSALNGLSKLVMHS